MFDKRITIFMGHYGSGKTFVATSYATALARLGKKVSIYDLDIVNPYFRTVDALDNLQKEGVELVVSPFAETNVDIPAMNAKSYQMLDDLTRFAVADIGGDDRGALALGRFYQQIKKENNYQALFVVNNLRPETRTIEGALEIMREIQSTAKMDFTGLVNNANLANETTPEIILSGLEFTNQLSKETGLPVKFTAIRQDLLVSEKLKNIKQVLPIIPIKYGDWQ